MNDERLKIYLHDHLALLVGEIELVRRCRSNNEATSLADYLQQLEGELNEQKRTMEDLLQRLGERQSVQSQLKQGAAWLAEKVGRFKLNDSLLSYSELSRLVELEMLTTTAHERVAMWDSLEAVTEIESRFSHVRFAFLRQQSQQQFDELNTRRRFAALVAFRTPSPEV